MRIGYILAIILEGLYLLGLFIGYQLGHNAALHQMRDVQKVCDQSHAVMNGYLEEKCGKAQDNTHTEYVCDGPYENSRCWVEVK